MNTNAKFHIPSPPSEFPFESQYVDVLGHKIHYVETGSGEPVLFFHGNPTSSYLWRNVIGPVAKASSRRVLAFDLLGFGKSDKPVDIEYTLKLHADIIEGFINILKLKKPILVGDDWGGALATHYAIRHRDNVQGLALMETFLWPMTWEDDFDPKFRVPVMLMRSPFGYLFTQVFNIMTKKLIPEHCPISPDALTYYIQSCPTIASREALGSFPKLLPIDGKPKASYEFFMEIQAGLKSFKAPVLWIKATPGVVPSDDYPPQAKRLDEIKALIPHMVIQSFGPGHHFLAEERPERVAELVSGWINEIQKKADMSMIEPMRNLAERLRRELHELEIIEKRMFGGVTFMLNGNMLCCASNKGLMVRVGKEVEPAALLFPHARPCDGAGHKMPGFVMIAYEGLYHNKDLSAAVNLALHYVAALPAKEQLPKATSRRPK